MNNISTIRDFPKYDHNNEYLYRNLAMHRLENMADGLPKEERAQYSLKNILGFNKEA